MSNLKIYSYNQINQFRRVEYIFLIQEKDMSKEFHSACVVVGTYACCISQIIAEIPVHVLSTYQPHWLCIKQDYDMA